MYNSHYQFVFNHLIDGIQIKVIRREDSMEMTEFELLKGTLLPEHVHTSDHSAYLLKGKIRMLIDGFAREFVQGDNWCIGKNICHCTEALEDSVVIEVYDIENVKLPEEKYISELV